MKKLMAAVMGLGMIGVILPETGLAQSKCPPELAQAKAALAKVQAPAKKSQTAGAQDVRPPGPRLGEGDIQVPRGGEAREADAQAPRAKKARARIRQAEQACDKGDMTLSAQKAREALELLK